MATFLSILKGLSGRTFVFALAFLFFLMTQGAAASGQQSPQATTRPDVQLQADVVAAITASPVLNVQPILAATSSGQVTLSGSVDDAASKELAEIVVSKVSGVQSVVNDLEVVPLGAPTSGDAGNGSAADNRQAPSQTPEQPTSAEQTPPAVTYPTTPAPPRPPYNQAPIQAPVSQGQYPPPETQYPNSRPVSSGPVLIPYGTLLRVRLSEALDTKRTSQGTMFQATSASDIYAGGVLAIPRGAILEGQVVDVRSVKGSLGGNASLSLQLNTLVLEGQTYPLSTDVWVSNGPGKGAYSTGNTIAGATIGAVIGGIAGGGGGAAIGATLGGVTGVAASSASSGPRVVLPPETVLSFHFATAVTVQPVTYQEAQRLAASQSATGASLEHRPGYPPRAVVYGYPYAYPYANPYPYGYPYRYGYPRYRRYRGW